MLSAQYRLKKNAHFNYAYRKGKSCSNRYMKLVFVRSGPPTGLRVGFSVSKKVGKAVVRNRVKRRMREALRPDLPRIACGYFLVFVARPEAAGLCFHEMRDSIDALLQKSGLIRE